MSPLCTDPKTAVHEESSVTPRNPRELTADEVQAWQALTAASVDLQSPFFHLEYLRAIAAFRSDVEVAVLKERGSIVGFFPFQRRSARVGTPIGGKLTDFQGMIGRLPAAETPRSLLSKCRLASWNFDHLPETQSAFASDALAEHSSPYLNLSQGWDAYQSSRCQAGSRLMQETERKRRKLAREVGEVRYQPNVEDDAVFEKLLQWKSDQRKRTQTFDVLQLDWVIGVLEHLRRLQCDSFGGQLSALFAGNELAAVHFGLTTKTVHHFWFPAYNPQLSKYSAGLILFLDLARHAAEQGAVRLDLGRGENRFKQRLASGSLNVLEGGVDRSDVRKCYRRTYHWARSHARRLPLQGLMQRSKYLLDLWYCR